MLVLGLGAALVISTGCRDRHETARQELKEKGYDVSPEAFFRAAESDDVKALEEITKNGIAIDTRNQAGDTALHAAAAAGMKESAKFLINHGLPVDVLNAEQQTPLMSAITKGTPAMVRFLLAHRADSQKKNAKGYKCLTIAVLEGQPGTAAALAAQDRDGLDDALLVAALEGRPTAIDELTQYGASIYARMDDGRTALMVAAQNGNVEAAEMLLNLGANRFSMDDQGRTAADLAREAGHEVLADHLAKQPKLDEFGLEEPSDLGKEMMDLIAAADAKAGLAAGVDPAGQPKTASAAPPAPLEAAVLSAGAHPGPSPSETTTQASAAPASPLVMRAYRQRELPLRVEASEGQVARFRMVGGGVEAVPEGGTIPKSRLKVVKVSSRVQSIKDSAQPASPVSVVELEDPSTGRRREIISGIDPTGSDPVALVEDSSGKRYVARAGQHFRSAGGEEFTVIDVRPNQMVIENRSKGEVITVPLRGPRG